MWKKEPHVPQTIDAFGEEETVKISLSGTYLRSPPIPPEFHLSICRGSDVNLKEAKNILNFLHTHYHVFKDGNIMLPLLSQLMSKHFIIARIFKKTLSGELCGLIIGYIYRVYYRGAHGEFYNKEADLKVPKSLYINYLCVHKKHREKGLAPSLILEISRWAIDHGICMAHYITRGPHHVATTPVTYWYRPIDVEKCQDLGFRILQPHIQHQNKRRKSPNASKLLHAAYHKNISPKWSFQRVTESSDFEKFGEMLCHPTSERVMVGLPLASDDSIIETYLLLNSMREKVALVGLSKIDLVIGGRPCKGCRLTSFFILKDHVNKRLVFQTIVHIVGAVLNCDVLYGYIYGDLKREDAFGLRLHIATIQDHLELFNAYCSSFEQVHRWSLPTF